MRLLLALLMIFANTAHAARYTYFPDNQLYPGAGFDLFHPDTAFPDCLDSDGVESGNHSQEMGTADTSRVSLKLLKTREDFYNFIHFSASMGGGFKFFSGSTSFSFEQEDKFHSDSITWGIVFETNFGIYKLKNPRLKPELRNLKPETLRARCGTEVVLKANKAVSVFATFTLHNVEKSHMSHMTASTNANFNAGIWNAAMQASYENILKTALAHSQLELEVYTVGGRGITKLSDLATTGSNPNETPYDLFKRVPEILQTYIHSLSELQSTPTEFYTGDISSIFGNDSNFNENESLQAKQLGRMYLSHIDAESDYQRIRNIFGVDREHYNMDDNEVLTLKSRRKQLNDVMNQIQAAAETCRTSKKPCAVPDIESPNIDWPTPIFDRCERQREIAIQEGCIGEDQAKISRLKHEVPACTQYDISSRFELTGWASCKP